jgi:hypothetical protein
LTDTTSAQTGLAAARAAVARAHVQSLINAAALAFATGALTSSTDLVTSMPGDVAATNGWCLDYR